MKKVSLLSLIGLVCINSVFASDNGIVTTTTTTSQYEEIYYNSSNKNNILHNNYDCNKYNSQGVNTKYNSYNSNQQKQKNKNAITTSQNKVIPGKVVIKDGQEVIVKDHYSVYKPVITYKKVDEYTLSNKSVK